MKIVSYSILPLSMRPLIAQLNSSSNYMRNLILTYLSFHSPDWHTYLSTRLSFIANEHRKRIKSLSFESTVHKNSTKHKAFFFYSYLILVSSVARFSGTIFNTYEVHCGTWGFCTLENNELVNSSFSHILEKIPNC